MIYLGNFEQITCFIIKKVLRMKTSFKKPKIKNIYLHSDSVYTDKDENLYLHSDYLH